MEATQAKQSKNHPPYRPIARLTPSPSFVGFPVVGPTSHHPYYPPRLIGRSRKRAPATAVRSRSDGQRRRSNPPPRHIVRSKARPRTCPGRAARVTRAVALPSPRAPHVTGPPGRRIAIGRPWIRRQWHGPTASRRGSADRRSGGDGAVTASGSRRGEGERER